jgi:hypothetical protein
MNGRPGTKEIRMKFAVCFVLALALSLPVQAQWPPRELEPGERLDEEIAVVTRSQGDLPTQEPAGSKALQEKASVTCSISFSPSLIGNSQQRLYSTSYGGTGCVTGKLVETVTWNWASIVSYYGEFQVQKKQFDITGCLASSGHVVSAPTGLGINGPTLVQFEVRGWPGNNLICSATTILTVN